MLVLWLLPKDVCFPVLVELAAVSNSALRRKGSHESETLAPCQLQLPWWSPLDNRDKRGIALSGGPLSPTTSIIIPSDWNYDQQITSNSQADKPQSDFCQESTAVSFLSLWTPFLCFGCVPMASWLAAESYFLKLWISVLKEWRRCIDPGRASYAILVWSVSNTLPPISPAWVCCGIMTTIMLNLPLAMLRRASALIRNSRNVWLDLYPCALFNL